jgi:hypothetical protein
MEKPTHQILNTIASNLGEPLSINQIKEKIRKKYGTAYYSNIYKQIKELESRGLLKSNSVGKSNIIKPNFDNDLTIDLFAEMELENKINFLTRRQEFLSIFSNTCSFINDMCFIKSISSINSEKNSELNRLELLFLLRRTFDYEDATCKLYKRTRDLQDKFNIRIDSLILNEDDFSSLIKTNEINPLKEAITEEITFCCPQLFWSQIKDVAEEGEIKTLQKEIEPRHIPEQDLIYNLDRFGYKEFGYTISQATKYCIEYIITNLLLSDDARKREAIPVLLAKNDFRINLLVFLCQKYKTGGKLLGLLKIVQSIKPTNKVQNTILLMKSLFDETEAPADEDTIMRNMRLYNVIQ